MKRWTLAAAVCLACCVATAAHAQGDLVLHYDFTEGKGDVLRDRSGNGLHGKIHGGRWVKGSGGAIEFDGKDDFVECPASADANTPEAFTVEAWVFPRRHGGGIFCRVTGGQWQDLRLSLTTSYGSGRPHALFCMADGKKNNRAKFPALETNAWTHLAVIFDGESARLLVNGAHHTSFVAGCKTDVADVPIWVGRSQGIGKRHYFKGRISEIRYYRRALSVADVRGHFAASPLAQATVRRMAPPPKKRVAGKRGLVGWWRFDEGSGDAARDAGGANNHGKITGATFVKRGKGHALRFDGEKGRVEVDAGPTLDIGIAGTISMWFKPEAPQGALFSWGRAAEPANRRFAPVFETRTGWGNPGNELRLMMGGPRRYQSYSQPLTEPKVGEWSHIVFALDGREMRCYRDGEPDMVVSLPFATDVRGLPFVMGMYKWSGKQVFKGLIDEVRVYDRPLSGNEVLGIYRNDAKAFGKDTALFTRPRLDVYGLRDAGRVAVRAHCALMAPLPKGAVIEASLYRPRRRRAVEVQARAIAPGGRQTLLHVDLARRRPGTYEIRAVVKGPDGKTVGTASSVLVEWPGRPKAFKKAKVLNNLVWELINERPGAIRRTKAYKFVQPKRRWVYVACKVARGAPPRAVIRGPDATEATLVFHEPLPGQHEAMHPLSAGEYTLRLEGGGGRVDQLIVRSVPDIVFAGLIPNPYIKSAVPLDDELIRKHVAPHVNTFAISQSNRRPRLKEPLFKELRSRGMRFVMHCSVPRKIEGKPITADQAYDYLAKTPGMRLPEVDGSMADEFGVSRAHCKVYADAWRRLQAEPAFSERMYFPYVGRLYTGPEGIELVKALADTGSAFALKRYLRIRHSEQASYDFAYRALIGDGRKYLAASPRAMESMIVCFGYLSAPNEFLNVVPQANYKAYLDMQFNMVANMPEYWATRGLMNYLVHYADEETSRWIAHLFRHYGIEGNTKHASQDSFDDSRLLANGDFAEDTRHWKLSPARPESIRRIDVIHFGWLQGRFQYTPQGDSALLMVRAADKPNVISQQIRNLEPGRMYAFRMITGEHGDMSAKEKHAVNIRIEGAEVLPDKSFMHIFHNSYAHSYGDYDRDNNAWMNYHWVLFRAKTPTATLTVSDWATPKEPGGPIGQEIMMNFLQVHPYWEG